VAVWSFLVMLDDTPAPAQGSILYVHYCTSIGHIVVPSYAPTDAILHIYPELLGTLLANQKTTIEVISATYQSGIAIPSTKNPTSEPNPMNVITGLTIPLIKASILLPPIVLLRLASRPTDSSTPPLVSGAS
jgi:hypothetical protein